MTPIHNLRVLYARELQYLLSVETQSLEALPLLADAAQDASLRKALLEHVDETRLQTERLRTLLEAMDTPVSKMASTAMHGIIADAVKRIEDTTPSAVRDAALVAVAQQIEHFEIALYGTARTFAITLGFSDAGALLHQTLTEEGTFDQRLTSLAATLNSLAQAPTLTD